MAALLTTTFSLVGCGGAKEVDKIADAQNCLDNAAPADVSACVAKVDGLESQAAYLIRCVGKFAKEGFNSPTKIANAMGSISNNSGSSGSTAMMAALAFQAESSSSLNASSAQEALSLCTQAKAKGLILLAGLASTATTLSALAGQNPSTLTGTDLQNLMGTLLNNPAAETAVGAAVTSIYSANCTNNSTTAGSFCTQFDSAVSRVGGITETSAIGHQIMTCYNNPAAAGCSGF